MFQQGFCFSKAGVTLIRIARGGDQRRRQLGGELVLHNLLFIFVSLNAHTAPACPATVVHPTSKKESVCDENGRVIRELLFSLEDQNSVLVEVNHYAPGSSRVLQRDIHRPHFGQPAQYRFEYDEKQPDFRFVKQIAIANEHGQPQKVYHVHVPDATIQQAQREAQDRPVSTLIIDTGFEWTHPLLRDKHYINPNEILNGLDDDQDGWIDNITTIKGVESGGGAISYVFNQNERLQIKAQGEPNSHGTFVASVAMRDIENSQFIGASGSIDSPAFLYKLFELNRRHKIQFTNMSFGFGDKNSTSFVDPDSHQALADFVQQTTDTLHVIAAGNHGIHFDESKYSEYPACLKSANRVTVGSLQTDTIDTDKLHTYQRSKMSSYGTRCVDIFAPGEKVRGAGLYPDEIQASGTSVASPFALNILLKVHDRLPDLSPDEYKKILLLTAYVPQSGFLSVRSGGIIFPERVLAVVDHVVNGWSIDDAVLHERVTRPARFEESSQEKVFNWWRQHRLVK